MPIVGGLDIHRKQPTFDYLDTVTGEVRRGQKCLSARWDVLILSARACNMGFPIPRTLVQRHHNARRRLAFVASRRSRFPAVLDCEPRRRHER